MPANFRETPLRGNNHATRPSLHVAFAGGLADIGACQGYGFSSSCDARKTPHVTPAAIAAQLICRLNRGTPWRKSRISS
jgi:hypothetical protein